MKPIVIPASTTNASIGGAITIIGVWAVKQFAALEIPDYVAQSFTLIVAVLLGHLTTDSPSASVAREAVAEASADADTDAATRKKADAADKKAKK